MDIAFIGIGVMGRSMVLNLMKAGHTLHVYSRRKASAQEVIRTGALWHDSLAGCAASSPVVISIVGYPKDVEEVYFSTGGILDSARDGAILIDMTTTSPRLAERIYQAAKEKGLRALDAPVSGGDSGAKNATLAIMAGGDEEVFKQVLPLLEAMGSTVRWQGPAGSGQHTKMANQISIAGAISGAAEALAYARAVGLNPMKMIDVVGGGSGTTWQLVNNGPKMVKGDFAPGFFVKHFIKDMVLAQEEAARRGVTLPMLDTVLSAFQALEARGLGDEGTQAIIKGYM
ncbi:MAG: NAD(P)-dependent oxidoreductase [Christensenellales bacterium]